LLETSGAELSRPGPIQEHTNLNLNLQVATPCVLASLETLLHNQPSSYWQDDPGPLIFVVFRRPSCRGEQFGPFAMLMKLMKPVLERLQTGSRETSSDRGWQVRHCKADRRRIFFETDAWPGHLACVFWLQASIRTGFSTQEELQNAFILKGGLGDLACFIANLWFVESFPSYFSAATSLRIRQQCSLLLLDDRELT
jgi:hypothetical protein